MTPDQRRIHELEAFNATLLRERALTSKVDRLEEDVERLREQRDEAQSTNRHLRAMLDAETKSGAVHWERLMTMTDQRNKLMEELSDYHDHTIDQFVHSCDGKNGCPVAELLSKYRS